MKNWTFEEILYGTPAYDSALKLRDKVLREPLGLEFTVDQISQEWQVNHLVARDTHSIIRGVLILQPMLNDAKQMKMRQVAIDPYCQSIGVGSTLVKFAEKFAQAHRVQHFVLNARSTAVSFYHKLDYKIQGKEFLEVGIPHFKMSKKLV